MLESGLPDIVANEETVIRFINEKGKITKEGVRFKAFLPKDSDIELSCYRYCGESDEEIKQLGIASNQPDDFPGFATLRVSDIICNGVLTVVADEPPPQHANITPWPVNENIDEQKGARHSLALELASKCKLTLFA